MEDKRADKCYGVAALAKMPFFAKIMIKFNKAFNVKIISVLIAGVFLFTNIAYGITPSTKTHLRTRTPLLGNSQEGDIRLRKALIYELLGQVVQAENKSDLDFYGEEKRALLLENGKILLEEGLYNKYYSSSAEDNKEALQVILHEIGEALLQAIEKKHPPRYASIKEIALNHLAELYFKTKQADKAYRGELLANDIWALIFEHRLMGIKPETVEDIDLREFLIEGYKIIETRGDLFGEEFSNLYRAKEVVIRTLREGTRFYRVASKGAAVRKKNISARKLSNDEISEIMKQKGYDQLKKIWEEFEELGIDVDEVDEEKIGKSLKKYFTMLRYARIQIFFLSPLSPVNIFLIFNIYLILTRFFNWTDTNLSLYLMLMPTTLMGPFALYVHLYYKPTRVKNIKAMELATLLSKENYRERFDDSTESKETMEILDRVGVNELWDNPVYHKVYRINGEAIEIEEVTESKDHITLTQKILRYFIGYRDETGQPHSGELTGGLKKGAKSSREILRKYKDIIDLTKKGELTRDNSLYFLNELKTYYIKPGSKGESIINDFIEAIAKKHYLIKGQVGVDIWQRDPWVDLSSHTEFNCCAFLGGISDLGVFGYMKNKSLSCLDFKTKEGRIVRIIIGAGIFTDEDGEDRGVLVVDSVEGTLSLDRTLIKQAIEDYASACGFSKVFYNDNVYNVVSKKFVKYVRETGAELEELDITLVDVFTREYLESFGVPFFIERAPRLLRGFLNFLFPRIDFVYPKGKVIGYTVDLQPQAEPFISAELPKIEQIDFDKVSVKRVSRGEWHNIKEDIMEIEEVFHENIRSPEEDLKEIFEDPTSITMVLKYDNKVVSYIAGGRLEDYDHIEGVEDDENYGKHNTAYIDSIAILDKFQGHGLVHNLRQEFLRLATEEGYSFVTAHHKKGIASKRGDEVLDEFDNWYDTGEIYEYSRTHLGEAIRSKPLYQSKDITIERTLPLDWYSIKDEILGVEEMSFPEGYRETEEELEASFTDPASVVLIVKFQGKIIAYTVGGPLEDYESLIKKSLLGLGGLKDSNLGLRNSFYMESIAVLPEYSQYIIGAKLFKILHKIVREKGYEYVTFHTFDERLMRLFLKLGAEMVFKDRWRGDYFRLPAIFPVGMIEEKDSTLTNIDHVQVRTVSDKFQSADDKGSYEETITMKKEKGFSIVKVIDLSLFLKDGIFESGKFKEFIQKIQAQHAELSEVVKIILVNAHDDETLRYDAEIQLKGLIEGGLVSFVGTDVVENIREGQVEYSDISAYLLDYEFKGEDVQISMAYRAKNEALFGRIEKKITYVEVQRDKADMESIMLGLFYNELPEANILEDIDRRLKQSNILLTGV